jgi:DNA (cytosine-5)-methyltransferase 1
VSAFYNEWERYPAAWIRNLIAAGHVADGIVDERSIVELRATDLAATQCHFFAGIGGWSYALRLAGWPDDRPVWTASCPCQPFSIAGKGRGTDDERHLWPVVFELVRECRPPILFGEQVASPTGRAWFDAVSADLESAGYAVGAANLCAAGVGAPHIRQRLYFVAVADADHAGPQGRGERRDGGDEWAAGAGGVVGDSGWLADSDNERREGFGSPRERLAEAAWGSAASRLGDADRHGAGRVTGGRAGTQAAGDRAGRVDGHDGHDADAPSAWSDAEWIACTDGKSRPAQPGSFPLVAGVSTRLGRDGAVETRNRKGELAGYGNAINAPLAATFIRAVMS